MKIKLKSCEKKRAKMKRNKLKEENKMDSSSSKEIVSSTRVYEKIKLLGQGAFGEVILVQDKKTKQQ